MFLLLMKMTHQKFFMLKSFGSIGFGGSCESDWLGGSLVWLEWWAWFFLWVLWVWRVLWIWWAWLVIGIQSEEQTFIIQKSMVIPPSSMVLLFLAFKS